MKKILFIIGYLGSGGISKSLVNLLTSIDRKNIEIHLLVMSQQEGAYEEFVPDNVIKHRVPEIGWILSGSSGILPLLTHGHVFLALGSLFRMLVSCFSKEKAARILAHLFPNFNEPFDLIIDYNGQQNLYYMVNKLDGKKKVTFFHSDYAKYPYYYNADKKYYPKVDEIFTISELCVVSMRRFFPHVSDKIHVFENISNPDIINKLSLQEEVLTDYDGIVLTTVGLISYNKGFDLIIGAADILRNNRIDFRWLMLGMPVEAANYMQQIEDLKLSDYFIFTGVKKNPYPYMRRATMMVHASRYEGKSITLDEAKILCKPIVVTNFSTVKDQFESGVNATISEMKAQALADSIIDLINNPEKRMAYQKYLKTHIIDNSTEVNKLYQLLTD